MLGRAAVVASVVTLVALATACGSSDDSTFGDGDGTNGNGDLTSGTGGFGGTSSGGSSSGGSSSGDVGNVQNVSPNDACATSNAGVDALPIHLVFMVDKSGSMGGGSLSTKWTPAVAALKDFFADAASANISASLQFFPIGSTSAGGSGCQSATYEAPAVAIQKLPDATTFAAALDANGPGGGTPTLPAEDGAIAYAQSVAAGLPAGEKIAIVLVTDGQPNDCSSTVSAVGNAAAAAAAAGIKTYVIGVGSATGNLDSIAQGGGTSPTPGVIQVNTSSAATTSADLRKAIGTIKASQLGCDYTLPPPPSGQTLDVNAVNVNYTPGGGTASTLPYSADCSNPGGWHYDSTTNPTKIVMCPTICSTLQNDTTGGKVDIIFGCKTSVNPGGTPPGVN